MIESKKRILGVMDIFQTLNLDDADLPVTPYFNLSSDLDEMGLNSTIGRELGFVLHHAIHHMAMCKIIATKTLKFEENELPIGFGKAPSTLIFEGTKKWK